MQCLLPTDKTISGTGDLMRIDRRFGTVLREGRWLVPGRIEVRLTAADGRLDFTEAVIGAGTVELEVTAYRPRGAGGPSGGSRST